MTLIVAISGKKQAGKNTVAEYVKHLQPNRVRLYSYADKLKQFCIECLGLSHRQCYGSDEDKNTLTHLLWENMPGVISDPTLDVYYSIKEYEQIKKNGKIDFYPGLKSLGSILVAHEPGMMTAREVMQFFGTEIGRRMYNNIWVDATIRQIKMDQIPIAIITDCRFPNEVHTVLDSQGIVIRLTRDIFDGIDVHDSELVLDADRFNWELFTYIVDNHIMTIDEANRLVYDLIDKAYNEKQKVTRRNTVVQERSETNPIGNEIFLRDGAF